jgi:hypothetical protein
LELLNIRVSTTNNAYLDQLQSLLLQGAREEACRYALTNKMWVEALIIGTHVNQKVYGEIVIEYLKQKIPINQNAWDVSHPALKILLAVLGNGEGNTIMQAFSSDPSFAESVLQNWNLVLGIIVMNRSANDSIFLQTFSRILFDSNYIGAGQLW